MYHINIVRPFHKPDFYIETTIKELYDTLALAYGDFVSEAPPSPDAYRMSFIDSSSSCDELQIIENAMYESTSIDEKYLALHSAVVEYCGKSFLFTGHTEAGKSTLTSFLCKTGLNYFSDDIAIIDRSDLTVHPYPRPVQLREGGVSVLKNHRINLDDCPVYSYGGLSRTMLYLDCEYKIKTEIGGIFFMERTQDVNSIEIMPKTIAFTSLLHNLFVYLPVNAELYTLLNKVASKPVYSLKYSNMEFVKELILKNG